MNVTSRYLLRPIDLTPQKFTDCQQIGIAIAIIFTIGALLIIGIGVAGHLKVGSLAHLSKTHSIIMMGAGAGTLFFIAGIGGIRYFMTRPLPVIRPPNSLKKNEWDKLNVGRSHVENYYDLTGTNKQPSYNAGGDITLPTFGTYKSYSTTIITQPDLSVGLPATQLSAFPQRIQDLFKYDAEIELYVLIYSDNTNLSENRNLILHHMALHEFDPNQHSWLQCEAEIGIYDPQGIKRASQEAIPFESTKDFNVILHGTSVSPNNCIFKLDQTVSISSFYTAARFRNRNVAFYTVLLRDSDSPEVRKINNAISQDKLSDCVHLLEQEGSPCAEEFKKLFAYYP